jgi:hypothetical protein
VQSPCNLLIYSLSRTVTLHLGHVIKGRRTLMKSMLMMRACCLHTMQDEYFAVFLVSRTHRSRKLTFSFRRPSSSASSEHVPCNEVNTVHVPCSCLTTVPHPINHTSVPNRAWISGTKHNETSLIRVHSRRVTPEGTSETCGSNSFNYHP